MLVRKKLTARGTRDMGVSHKSTNVSQLLTLVSLYTNVKKGVFAIEILESYSGSLAGIYVNTIGLGVEHFGSAIEIDTV